MANVLRVISPRHRGQPGVEAIEAGSAAAGGSTGPTAASSKRDFSWLPLTRGWLGQSLRRWLVFPAIVVTIFLAAIALLGGSYLMHVGAQEVVNNSLVTGSAVAESAIGENARFLSGAVSQLVQQSGAQAPVRPDSEAFSRQAESMAGAMGLDVLGIVDTADATHQGLSSGFTLHMLVGREHGFFLDAGVGQAILRALADQPGQGRVQVGITAGQGEALLYAVTPVGAPAGAGDSPDGAHSLLLAGRRLTDVLQEVHDAVPGVVAFYDTDGRPIFSTFPAGNTGMAALPAQALDGTKDGSAPRVFQAMVGNDQWLYAPQSVRINNANLGYVAVWQQMNLAAVFTRRWQTLFVLFIAAAVANVLILNTWLAGRVIRPVVGMVDTARAVAKGDFARPVPATSIGELALLAEVLNNMAGQVQRQTSALREQAQNSNYLFEASSELGRTLDLEESLQTAAEAIYGLGTLSYVVVLTGRGELGPYTCRAVCGLAPETAAHVLNHEYAVPLSGVMARALVGRQPLMIEDVVAQNRPREGEFNWDVGRGSMLLFPVSGATGPFALLIIGSQEPNAFSAGNLGELVFALAQIASHSIQNARLYQEAVRSQEQLVTLQAISRAMASSQQIEKVLEMALREAAEITGNGHAGLFLRDENHAVAEPAAIWPHGSDGQAWTTVDRDAVAWVLQAGQPIFYSPDRPLVQSPILLHSGTAMCVPLESGNDTIGALAVVSRQLQRAFVEDDMIVLRTLANAAAASLHTRQMVQQSAESYADLAQAWARYADGRTWGSVGHAQRVADNAGALARATGLPAELAGTLQMASLLHDIAAEKADEDVQVSADAGGVRHATVAAEWLAAAGIDRRIATLVRHHHTARPDLALNDAELGQAASILALVHAVDTWLAGDAEHPRLSAAELSERLRREAGGKFGPGIVEKFLELWSNNQINVP